MTCNDAVLQTVCNVIQGNAAHEQSDHDAAWRNLTTSFDLSSALFYSSASDVFGAANSSNVHVVESVGGEDNEVVDYDINELVMQQLPQSSAADHSYA